MFFIEIEDSVFKFNRSIIIIKIMYILHYLDRRSLNKWDESKVTFFWCAIKKEN